VGGLLPALELLRLEPESDLLLGRLDGVGAVADVAADVLCKRKKKVVSDTVLNVCDRSSMAAEQPRLLSKKRAHLQ